MAYVKTVSVNIDTLNRGDLFVADGRVAKVLNIRTYETTRIIKIEFKYPGQLNQNKDSKTVVKNDEFFAHIGDYVDQIV